MTIQALDWRPNMITFVLAAVWVYAAVRIHLLATRASRLRVRREAGRTRSALLVAILLVPAAVAAIAGLWPDGARLLTGPAPEDATLSGLVLAGPLLVLPAAAAVIWSLPRLGRIIRMLYAHPRGPSDLPIRDACADPALAVPVYAGVLGALATALAVPSGAAATGIAYAVVVSATAALWQVARGRWRAVRRTPEPAPAGAGAAHPVRPALEVTEGAEREAVIQ